MDRYFINIGTQLKTFLELEYLFTYKVTREIELTILSLEFYAEYTLYLIFKSSKYIA